jgi:hypothetical protein
MNIVIRFGIASIAAALALAISPVVFAQGSTGGSIGDDEKSVSGSRHEPSTERELPAQRNRSNDLPRRSSRQNSGGSAGNFDGAWIVTGVGVTCAGSSRNAVVVTSGKIIGETARGTVSPNGTVHGYASGNGITITTTGRLSGRTGGGTFRQSDGCTGRWTATKQ